MNVEAVSSFFSMHSMPGGEEMCMKSTWVPRSDDIMFEHPDLFRGSYVADSALRNLGAILDKGPCTTAYELSRPVDHIEAFISHNWSTPRRVKFLVLALHFNCKIALLLSVLVSSVMLALEVAGVLPFVSLIDRGETTRVAYWCQVIGVLTFLVALLFWHDIARLFGIRGQTVFLDKACVHQTDESLKRDGIEHLAGFIYYSWSVVVVYSDVYLQKLWTMYEIASFLLLHPQGQLHIRPLFLPKAVLGGALFFLVLTSSCQVLHSHWFQDSIPASSQTKDLALALIVAAPASWTWSVWTYRYALQLVKISERAHSFRISDAICFDESDRKAVQRNIVGFMKERGRVASDATDKEAVAKFEYLVRKEVPRQIAVSLGRGGIPFHMAAAMTLPYLLQQFDEWGVYLTDPNPVQSLVEFSLDFARKVTTGIAVVPSGSALTLWLAKYLITNAHTGPLATTVVIFIAHITYCYSGFFMLKVMVPLANDGDRLAQVALGFLKSFYILLSVWFYLPAPSKVHRRKYKHV